MIVTGSYTDSRYRAAAGEGYDGVVKVSSGSYYGTGTLLYNGLAILTAAHLFKGQWSANVTFETISGTQTISANKVVLHPSYDSVNSNHDLAIVWLSNPAPTTANRYPIYHQSNEIGQTITMVGYGLAGSGTTGDTLKQNNTATPLRIMAQNTVDADVGLLNSQLGYSLAWSPISGTQLIADFDNGYASNDASGRLLGVLNTGLGQSEGIIAPGDSGGPAFINGALAGVASYSASLSLGNIHPDIDNTINSSFGEIAAWQRVSYYQQWIDQSIRAQYPNAPTQPEAVQKTVQEGNSGTSYAYFLLQFTGIRTEPNQLLSVDYTTRNGTAIAGQDFIGQQGTLILYPNETQAVVAVEIIGDTITELDETFYLDITNPIGGCFGTGVSLLTAMRTIVNDDFFA